MYMENDLRIQIAIATTKKYRMPEDDIYMPIQVGAEGKPPIERDSDKQTGGYYFRDDTGDQISSKNPGYCELTGMYWLWKNSDADYCGLVHYRRHFSNPGLSGVRLRKFNRILDRKHLETVLSNTDIVFPRKRRYYVESMYSHYIHSHFEQHINAAKQVITELCPEYLDVFTVVLKRTNGHMFNMLIMKRDKFDAYCEWLFPILERLEQIIDTTEYDAFQKRYIGRVAELLLDVWIEHNGYTYWELPTVMLGRIHWGRKIFAFLGAKIFGRRYTKSF